MRSVNVHLRETLGLFLLPLLACQQPSGGSSENKAADTRDAQAPPPNAATVSSAPAIVAAVVDAGSTDAAADASKASRWPKPDHVGFEAFQSRARVGETALIEVGHFVAADRAEVAGTACNTTLPFKRVRLELDKMPAGTMRALLQEKGCRKVIGRLTGWTGGGPNGLHFMKVIALPED